MIVITLDIEWATDHILQHALEILDVFEIPVTLFSTHDDPFKVNKHERAIHPNFDVSEEPATIVEELCNIYPDAIGLRSHRMCVSTTLRNNWIGSGIKYESNYMQYKMSDIEPFGMPEGTTQFPVYWMDDVWFRSDGEQINAKELLDPTGLKVFDFHPQHIYFNTPNVSYYQNHKETYWDDEPNDDQLRYDGFGVRNIFLDILQEISEKNLETMTLGELYRQQN